MRVGRSVIQEEVFGVCWKIGRSRESFECFNLESHNRNMYNLKYKKYILD